MRCVRTICHQFLAISLTHLLNKTLPWDRSVRQSCSRLILTFCANSELVDMWKVLCGEETILRKVFTKILDVLTLSLPYQEKNKNNKIIRLPTETPQSVSPPLRHVHCTVTPSLPGHQSHCCALQCRGNGPHCQRILSKGFCRSAPEIRRQLDHRHGSKVFVSHMLKVRWDDILQLHFMLWLSVCSVAIDAMQQFLKSTESSMMLQVLEDQNAWSLFEKEDTSPHGVLHMARALAAEHFDLIQNCVDELSSSLTSIYDAHRITVVAFYSEVCSRHVAKILDADLRIHSLCFDSWCALYKRRERILWRSRS